MSKAEGTALLKRKNVIAVVLYSIVTILDSPVTVNIFERILKKGKMFSPILILEISHYQSPWGCI